MNKGRTIAKLERIEIRDKVAWFPFRSKGECRRLPNVKITHFFTHKGIRGYPVLLSMKSKRGFIKSKGLLFQIKEKFSRFTREENHAAANRSCVTSNNNACTSLCHADIRNIGTIQISMHLHNEINVALHGRYKD